MDRTELTNLAAQGGVKLVQGPHVRPPRVLLLTQYFPPEPYPQALWFAEALRDIGCAVRITTSIPNYPSGDTYSGYSASRVTHESLHGFFVNRVPVYPSHDGSASGRILNYASFAASSAYFDRRAVASADVVVVWATPATVGSPALLNKLMSGTPYILYVQDLWPDSVFASGFLSGAVIDGTARFVLEPYLELLYGHASHVVAITEGMEQELVSRGVSPERCGHVYNWVDERVLKPEAPNGILRTALRLSPDAFLIAYAGNLGAAQGLDSWLEAMRILRANSEIHLVLVGAGSERERLVRLKERESMGNVHFVPSVPYGDLSRFLADADALAISLVDDALFEITMPSKVQASLAQAKPIVASVSGETRHVLKSAGSGWLAEPERVDTIVDAIRDSWRQGRDERVRRGKAGRRYYEQHMSRRVGSEAFAQIIGSSLQDRRN